MGIFLNKHKIFISHKRENGDASADALLIKDYLDKKFLLHTFMDVHEDTLGEFPQRLKEEIDSSQTFIFIIPSDGNVSFLFPKKNENGEDEVGWVYKEIHHALNKYVLGKSKKQNNFQILPVTYSNNFKWPNNLPTGIEKIRDFDICKLHRNEKQTIVQEKLLKSINYKPLECYNIKGILMVLIALFFVVMYTYREVEKREQIQEREMRIEYIRSSWADKHSTKPIVDIPQNERTTFEDSIYKFFELKDSAYKQIGELPSFDINIQGDEFTRKRLEIIAKRYISVGNINERLMLLVKYICGNSQFDKTCYTAEELDGYTNELANLVKGQIESTSYSKNSLQKMRQYIKTNNIRSAFATVNAVFAHNYVQWVLWDDLNVFYEKNANLFNKQILKHKRQEVANSIDEELVANTGKNE